MRLWRGKRLLVLAFAFSLAASLFLGGRTIAYFVYWTDHRDQQLEPWMTPGYIAQSWDVDRDIVLEAIGMPVAERTRRPIGKIADDKGMTFQALSDDVMAAIGAERSGRQTAPDH